MLFSKMGIPFRWHIYTKINILILHFILTMTDLLRIVESFALPKSIIKTSPLGNGHINDTFILKTAEGYSDYVLQKINTAVFKDVEGLMRNISLVTSKIQEKLGTDAERKALQLIKTKDGTLSYTDLNQDEWRIYNYIADHKVYDLAPNLEVVQESGKMFGDFLTSLSDLPTNSLVTTIPKFHDIKWRLKQLKDQIDIDAKNRKSLLSQELNYVKSHANEMCVIQNLGEKGAITLRITHNDTKLNNVLFDNQNNGLCVIDLDTVMPGYVHYDFGDGIRSAANTGEEDDQDLKNVTYDLQKIEAFAKGYLSASQNILNPIEKQTLANSVLLFPYLMGVRFLTDYIAGDVYYKTKYEGHNLVRARAQFQLAMDGQKKIEPIKAMVNKIVKA